MARQHIAQIILVGHDIDRPWRHNILPQCSNFQSGKRGCCSGLHHNRIAGKQGGTGFVHCRKHRKIPRYDRRNHAKRLAMQFHAAHLAVFNHFDRYFETGIITQEISGAADFTQRIVNWLALFAGQRPGNGFKIGFDRFGHFDENRAPFFKRCCRPGRIGCRSCGNCILNLFA